MLFRSDSEEERKERTNGGILFCSGLIAGEGLVGILLAVFAIAGITEAIDFSEFIDTGVIGGIALLVIMVLCVLRATAVQKNNKK